MHLAVPCSRAKVLIKSFLVLIDDIDEVVQLFEPLLTFDLRIARRSAFLQEPLLSRKLRLLLCLLLLNISALLRLQFKSFPFLLFLIFEENFGCSYDSGSLSRELHPVLIVRVA